MADVVFEDARISNIKAAISGQRYLINAWRRELGRSTTEETRQLAQNRIAESEAYIQDLERELEGLQLAVTDG